MIGNHEHCIQESKLENKDHLITYCLGNYTSNYGIDRKPYDKNAECSVLLNLYLNEETKKIDNIGFEILVSVKDENGVIKTKPIYDCIKTSEGINRQTFCEKDTKAVNTFLNTDYKYVDPQKEYFISQIVRGMGK